MPSKSHDALVIEVGGTTTRLAVMTDNPQRFGNPLRVATPNYLIDPHAGAASLLRALFARIYIAARQLMERRTPELVVIAYPGPLSVAGVALRSPTILGPQSTETVNVRMSLQNMWPAARIHVLNDLTAAGYFFVKSGHTDFCVTAVGSGIGNKVFLGGHPHIGAHGFGGEIGHLRAQPKPGSPIADVQCDLGEIASGRGTTRLARMWLARRPQDAAGSPLGSLFPQDADEMWAHTLARAFAAADPLAERILEATTQPLAHALSALHTGLGLEKFFMVGGFAHALGQRYRELLIRLASEACWNLGQRWDEMIEVGAPDEEEGLSGARHLTRLLMRSSQYTPCPPKTIVHGLRRARIDATGSVA